MKRIRWFFGLMIVSSALALGAQSEVEIVHDPIDCWPVDEFPLIESSFVPPDDVQTVKFYFRSTDHPDYYYVELTLGQGAGRAIAPKADPSTSGVTYYIELVTRSFSSFRTEEHDVPVASGSECKRRDPETAYYTGENPDIAVGATRSGVPQMPPGFQSEGVSRFMSVTGSQGGTGGGGFSGKTVGIIAAVGGGAGAALALSGGGGSDPTTTSPVGGITTTSPSSSSTSTAIGGVTSTTTTSTGGGGGSTTTVVGGGSTTTVFGSTTTIFGSSTTTVVGGSTTTTVVGGSTTTTVVGGSTTTSIPSSSTTTSIGTSSTTTSAVSSTTTSVVGSSTTSVGTSTTTTTVGTSTTTSSPSTTTSAGSTTTTSTPSSSSSTTTRPTTSVPSGADMRLDSIDDSLDPVVTGGVVEYDIGVTNLGPSNAPNVLINIQHPSSDRVLGSLRGPSCRAVGATLGQCSIGALPANGSAGAFPQIRLVGAGTHNITVTVGGGTTDPNPGNNSQAESTRVTLTQRTPDSPPQVQLVSMLDVRPPDGRIRARIVINESVSEETSNTGQRPHRLGAQPGENHATLQAELGRSDSGTWRVDFGTTRTFLPGSLRVQSGRVLGQDGSSITFALEGGSNEFRFTFELSAATP